MSKGQSHFILSIALVLFFSLILHAEQVQLTNNKFRIQEELTIGVSEGEPEFMFSRISAITVDGHGRIYILDFLETELRIFGSDGKHIRTVGRRGQGPGEFMGPFSIAITAQNSIMVHDLMNHRISYFSMEGDFMHSFSTADLVIVGCDDDGHGNVISLVFTHGPGKQVLEVQRFDSQKKILASYLTVTKTGTEAINNPMGPDVYWTRYLENQVICGYSKSYKLHVYDLEGSEIRTIEHDFKPVRVDQDKSDSLKKRLPAMVDAQIPKYHPAFQGVTADEDGRVFVATWERPEDGKGYLYDVFDRKGTLATQIVLEYPPGIWKGSKLYTIEEEENGYPTVKRYGVSWE